MDETTSTYAHTQASEPPNSPHLSTSPRSVSTGLTIPDNEPVDNTSDDDIWASDSDFDGDTNPNTNTTSNPTENTANPTHPTSPTQSQPQLSQADFHSHSHFDSRNAVRSRPRREEVLSDLPSLKRQHMTTGYREGLSIGKAQVMQSGFDAGYPIGVGIALRIGAILGVLEGYLAGISPASCSPSASTTSTTTTAKPSRRDKADLKANVETDVDVDVVADASVSMEMGIGEKGRTTAIDGASTSTSTQTQSQITKLRQMYDLASEELSCPKLLGTLSDEDVDRASTTAIPRSIEDVLVKWERRVLG